jgi:hypothetical protein
MHQDAVFSLLSRGSPLAAAIEASRKERLAWVGVYPLDLSKPLTQEFLRAHGIDLFPVAGRAYRVRTLEVERRLIEADASIGESDLANTTSKIVFSYDDLLRALEAIGVRVESLELPYESSYPI